LPYAVAKYRSRAFARRLRELIATRRFDLVVCDFLFPAVNLPARLPCPAVIFTHNVESEIWRRHAETKWFPARLLYILQYRRMLRFEGRTLRRFDAVLAVSDADRQTFARAYPNAIREPVHVVPTGVDTAYFVPGASDPASRSIVFTGSMDWLPNEDAMCYFVREVLPLVRAEEPSATLSIVGRAPTPSVRKLAVEAGVTVTGGVPDVRPYVRGAAVYIVPLRIGGGTRLKIFEAMAMGKAIVSTAVGAEGLPVTEGEHLLLADEPHAFARDIVRLMRDGHRRNELERAARAFVVAAYDWSAVAGALETALLHTVRTRTPPPPSTAQALPERGAVLQSLPGGAAAPHAQAGESAR
jgi:sugar transferase (PEP-CTERM/EpsH1 system associated)